MTIKYGGRNTKLKNETWESLLDSANSDFISVLILWYSGVIPKSTYGWMLPHTLEKYLKSYLLKSNMSEKEIKKLGHSLVNIWERYKKISNASTKKTELNEAFEQIIKDLSTMDDANFRYSGSIGYCSDKLLYFYIVLTSFIRYLLIGETQYRSTLYGLNEYDFLPMNYEPMSVGYGKIIVHKMLHLALEHAACFTNLGLVNNMGKEYSISNTAKFEKLDECPICNDTNNLDQLTLVKFYRDIKPVNSLGQK